MTSSMSSGSANKAARVIAAAVLRPAGSSTSVSMSKPALSSWRSISGACTSLATISGAAKRPRSRIRAIVIWSIVPDPISWCSCLGVDERDTGHRYPPLPKG